MLGSLTPPLSRMRRVQAFAPSNAPTSPCSAAASALVRICCLYSAVNLRVSLWPPLLDGMDDRAGFGAGFAVD